MQRRDERKAAPVVSHGLTMVTAFTALLCMLPVPSTMMEKAAPKAAALDRPRVKGEPRGFRSADCITVPARERPPPARRAARVWGRRMFITMMRHFASPPPRRVLTTSATGMETAPRETEKIPITRQAAASPKRKILLRPTCRS